MKGERNYGGRPGERHYEERETLRRERHYEGRETLWWKRDDMKGEQVGERHFKERDTL